MIVLDEQLLGYGLQSAIARWYRGRVIAITELRPGSVIRDEAIPVLLRAAPRSAGLRDEGFIRSTSFNMPRLKTADSLSQVSGRLPLDADALRGRVDAVLADSLYWFPVRHHSPAVARHLEATIAERAPKIIFIEGPHEANDLVPYLVDPKTKPPVAIYSSYRDDDNVLGLAGIESPSADIPPRFSCWYPLLAYSPEYVALLAARKIGARAVFIDLPHYALVKPAAPEPEAVVEEEAPAAAKDKDKASRKQEAQRDSDRLIVESGFYRMLARSAGYRTWDEAWDSLFEARAFDGVEAFRRELATFCAAVRATADPERMAEDGTRPRERFMLKTIRETLARAKVKPEQALVVSGGFHMFLDRDDPEPPPELPAGTVYTTVVPYSFFRVSELSGYAAGNRAPQFYQSCWELEREGRAEDILIEHVVHVLKQGRQAGEALSSADAIAVAQHARMLARLRGRPTPVLDDIHDALLSCCCKGDPADQGVHLQKAIDAADIGTRIGRVTPKLGRLPIVNDFYTQLDELELGEVLGKEKRVTLDLDKRLEPARRRSVFLHRLKFLEIPLAALADAPSGDFATGTIFREKWALRWGPQVEPALIEQNLYGDTVEAAALARLREELARDASHAGRSCQRLVEAVDMDLPDLVRQVEDACGQAIDTDSRFVSLSQALAHLTVIDRYAVYRNLRRNLLDALIVRCFDRACFSILDAVAAPEEEQPQVVSALLALAEVVVKGGREQLDRGLFTEHVRKAAGATTVPFLRGVFLGMLAELRELTPEELAGELAALARAPVETMVHAGDFLDGILAVSRTSILLGADALIAAVDELLRAAEWEAFLTFLPRMRAAFERLHEHQRASLAAKVAERYGLADKEALTELRTSVAAAARIARIDQEVARIMAGWEF